MHLFLWYFPWKKILTQCFHTTMTNIKCCSQTFFKYFLKKEWTSIITIWNQISPAVKVFTKKANPSIFSCPKQQQNRNKLCDYQSVGDGIQGHVVLLIIWASLGTQSCTCKANSAKLCCNTMVVKGKKKHFLKYQWFFPALTLYVPHIFYLQIKFSGFLYCIFRNKNFATVKWRFRCPQFKEMIHDFVLKFWSVMLWVMSQDLNRGELISNCSFIPVFTARQQKQYSENSCLSLTTGSHGVGALLPNLLTSIA